MSKFDPIYKAATGTFLFYRGLAEFIVLKRKYDDCKFFQDDLWAKVYIYSLSLIFTMWNKTHYRSKSFQEDLLKNLSNVAVPGTGVPLNNICYSSYIALLFLVIFVPIISFLGALNNERKKKDTLFSFEFFSNVCDEYVRLLLHPDDWFSFWQLNCRLTSYHSLLTKAPGFRQENKWHFLQSGKDLSIPVTPFLSVDSIVCKHINIEGGQGIHIFRNALSGGEWIIQERLANANWLQALLPVDAPLSTMRIITTSTWSLESKNFDSSPSLLSDSETDKYISALSAVLRLGLSGADTDHKSVLFQVDLASGVIGSGTSNLHWYQLGLQNIFTCPWNPDVRLNYHPNIPDQVVSGKRVPNMSEAVQIVKR